MLLAPFSAFLSEATTPFHATAALIENLLQAGFKPLSEAHDWVLIEGQGYFVTRNDSSLIAFYYTQKQDAGWHMVGAHTDSPALKIKPNPARTQAGVHQVGVEVYGGALLNPWFDRDLGIAGRVSFIDTAGITTHELIDFKRAVAIIPSLAIHLDREANTNRSINAQNHLPAVLDIECGKDFHMLLQEALPQAKTILSFDLFLYDTQKPTLLGEGLLIGSKLDNLLSAFCAVQALIDAKTPGSMVVLHDHEEVGSGSYHGAQSNFLTQVLERLAKKPQELAKTLHHTYLISTDNAHALHPNYIEMHEPSHAPQIGQGIAIKHHAGQSYATDSVSAAYFLHYAHKAGIKTQSYTVRSDMRCGSTIGPITATKMGIKTVDIGVPTWAMHSLRETAACSDVEDLHRVLTFFYKR